MEQPILPLSGKKAKDTNIFHSILRSKILSSIEKEEDRIAQEAFVVLVAGGETTAQVLTTATFHLLANKDTALLRLKDELNGIMLDPEIQVSLKILEQLPWLVSGIVLYGVYCYG